MKNKNTTAKKAILEYMTWGSPLNQAFIIEALGRDQIEFTYKGNETNITKVKQAMTLFGPDRIAKALKAYASDIWSEQDTLRETMKNHFIHPEAWIKCAKDALTLLEPVVSEKLQTV